MGLALRQGLVGSLSADDGLATGLNPLMKRKESQIDGTPLEILIIA